MNKWQKITGIIVISILIIAHIWAFIDYLYVAELAGAWCAEMPQAAFFDSIYNFRQHFWYYNVLAMVDVIVIIWLFMAIWQKGDKL